MCGSHQAPPFVPPLFAARTGCETASAKTTPQIWTKVARSPSILPRADSTPPVKGQHEPRGAAAPNGLGFEPWTAGRIPAGKRYNQIGVPGPTRVPKESPPHPDTRPKGPALVRNSFTHLNLNI